MRIRVCRSGDQECFVKKHSICPCVLLFPSSAEFLRKYHIKCAPLHAECTVVLFYQLCSGSRDRALPEGLHSLFGADINIYPLIKHGV